MTGLLIPTRVHANGVCCLLRFLLEKIRKYFCFYFYLSSFLRKLLLPFSQVVFLTKYFYSSSFRAIILLLSSTKISYSSQLCTCSLDKSSHSSRQRKTLLLLVKRCYVATLGLASSVVARLNAIWRRARISA